MELDSAVTHADMPKTDVECPLCGDKGFDAFGFILHIKNGWCEPAGIAEELGWQEERERNERIIAARTPKQGDE